MATSGSSGMPSLFVYDRGAWTAQMAQTVRSSEWSGIKPSIPRRRIATISGSNPAHMTRRMSESLDIGMHRLLRFGVTDPLEEIIAGLDRFKPDLLVLYPSLLPPLADAIAAGRLEIAPGAIQTTSEPLTPALRELCERSFGHRPYDFFGCTEGLFATECERRDGMHLYEDCTIVEVVDNDHNPVPNGEPGSKLLLTNLHNRVQPLIRLELSDSVTIADEPCACGRTLRRLRTIDGRSNDVLELGGVSVHPQRFGLLGRDPAVRGFQVIQRGDGVRIRLVLEDAAPDTAERLAGEVRAELTRAGLRDPRVEAETVAAIERAPSGKVQQIVAERPGAGAQPTAPDSRSAAISSGEKPQAASASSVSAAGSDGAAGRPARRAAEARRRRRLQLPADLDEGPARLVVRMLGRLARCDSTGASRPRPSMIAHHSSRVFVRNTAANRSFSSGQRAGPSAGTPPGRARSAAAARA